MGRFLLFDNGWKTIDRYTIVDTESKDVGNEEYMQCTSFSLNWDTPSWIISHSVVYKEDFDSLWERPFPPDIPENVLESFQKVVKKFYQ